MTTLSIAEVRAISGGTCYSAGIDLFGLKIGIHIGDCPLNT